MGLRKKGSSCVSHHVIHHQGSDNGPVENISDPSGTSASSSARYAATALPNEPGEDSHTSSSHGVFGNAHISHETGHGGEVNLPSHGKMSDRLQAAYEGFDDEQLLGMLPKGPAGEATSIGSVLHDTAQCQPCRSVVAGRPCFRGIRCPFCHMAHTRHSEDVNQEGPPRPSRDQRRRYNNLVERVQAQIRADPRGFDLNSVEIPPNVADNPELKQKFLIRLTKFRDSLLLEASEVCL